MTVQKLIDILMEVENKELPIFIYDNSEGEIKEIFDDEIIDETITDRVDINIF